MTDRPVSGPPALDVAGAPTYSTKAQLAYAAIRTRILHGEFTPGQTVEVGPVADTLGFSRMPVREAFTRLAAQGLVITLAHRSAIIAPLSQAELDDIYAARRLLEPLLARTALDDCPDHVALAAEVDALITQQAAATRSGNVRLAVEVDRSIHRALYRFSPLIRTREAVEQFADLSVRYIAHFAASKDGAKASIAEHKIMSALVRKADPDGLATEIESHISRGYVTLSALMDEPSKVGRSSSKSRDHGKTRVERK